MDGVISNQSEMQLSRKTLWDHIGGIAVRWPQFVVAFVAVFGVFWTVTETATYFVNADFRGFRFYAVVVGFSFVAAACWVYRLYVNAYPPGFDTESPRARRIAQLQRTKWEFLLAHELLSSALRDLDDEFAALSEERVFVPITRRMDVTEYMEWVGLASDNLSRMVDIAQKLLVVDFATALGCSDFDARPAAIRSTVRRVRELYSDSIAFERSRREVQPPEGWESLYALQFGWSDPIRDGVRQLFDMLDQAIAIDKKAKKPTLQFTVVLGEPQNTAPFCAEVERLRSRYM